MPFVYRYIDIEAREVVYVGKVAKGGADNCTPLDVRHRQHTYEEWYKGNACNLVMQYMEVDTVADADILETWLISQYGPDQLVNISKSRWGKSRIVLWSIVTGRWKTYRKYDMDNAAIDALHKCIEMVSYDADTSAGLFCDMVKDIETEKDKISRLILYGEQMQFIRPKDKMLAEQKA